MFNKTDIFEIFRAGTLSYLFFPISLAIGFFWNILLVRFLSPVEVGLIFLVVSVLSISATVSNLGLANAALRFPQKFKVEQHWADLARLQRIVIFFPLIFGLIVACFLIFLNPFLVNLFDINLSQFWIVVLILLPVQASTLSLIKLANGKKRPAHALFLGTVALKGLPVLAILFLVFVDITISVKSFLYSLLIGWGLVWLAGFIFKGAIPSYSNTENKLPTTRSIDFFIFSVPLMLTGVLSLVLMWTDTFMISFLLGNESVAVYNIALYMGNMVKIFGVTAIQVLLVPILTGLLTQNKQREATTLISELNCFSILLSFPIGLFIVLNCNLIIELFFTPTYLIGVTSVLVLCLSFVIGSLFSNFRLVLVSEGRTQVFLYLNIFLFGFNFLLNYLLIPKIGIVGAALSTGICDVLIGLLCFFLNKNRVLFGRYYLEVLVFVVLISVSFILTDLVADFFGLNFIVILAIDLGWTFGVCALMFKMQFELMSGLKSNFVSLIGVK